MLIANVLCFQCHFSLILVKLDYILPPCVLLLSFFYLFFLWCSINVFRCPSICSCSFLLISCFCDQSMFLIILTFVLAVLYIYIYIYIYKINSLVTLHLLLLFFSSFFYFWCSINVSNCNCICSNYFPFFLLFFRLNLCFYLSFVKESPSKARFQRFYSQLMYHQNGSIALGYVTINYI
jgi:hypothetical protein